MNRILLALSAAALVAGAVPATALADEIELGKTSSPLVAPVCPAGVSAANCTIVLTQVTALETIRDGVNYPTTVRHSGEIVALRVGLSSISANSKTRQQDISFLNSTYGGPPSAEVTVLRPIGRHADFGWQVAATSPAIQLQRYLGQVAQFPLANPLPVVPGETIALTVPTWAPVLSFDLASSKFAYRQSRRANCNHPAGAIQAQLTIGARAHYRCNYGGTRVEYSATEITSPSPTS